MTFPAFESLVATIEPARQLVQAAGMLRDRATVLGVAIDAGTATGVDLIKWTLETRNILAVMQANVAISGMQATVRILVGNGALDLAAERTALVAALATARTAAQALAPSIAPVWDAATGTIKATAPLTAGAALTTFRNALTALVATIAPGAA